MTAVERVLPLEPIRDFADYERRSVGGRGIARAVELGTDATIAAIVASGLTGRGGGGFPTGRKWEGVLAQGGSRRYVVANGAEGEPATFKDRALLRANPYQVIEGLVIAAYAIGAAEAYIALKASFREETDRVTRAIAEMQRAGVCADCSVIVVGGPDEYLFGEEKALLEVIEGNAPLPRLLPPFQHGLFATASQSGWIASSAPAGDEASQESNPTLVNNVETLAHVAHVLANGPEWFRELGTPSAPGTIVVTVVGDVQHAGVGEVEQGTRLGDAISSIGGGLRDGTRPAKAVFSGVANPVLTADALGVPLTHDDMRRAGGGLGACGFWVLDETACMVEAVRLISRFLYVESCGQCPPCKRGSGEITERLTRVEGGVADEHDIEELRYWIDRVTDGNRCFLAVEERDVVASVLRMFPGEFAEHLELGRCPRPRTIELPKLVDLRRGDAVHDASYARKQPDWTYAPE